MKAGIHLKSTTGPKERMYADEYYWIAVAKNGRTIARSSETYKRKEACVKSMRILERIFSGYVRYLDHTVKQPQYKPLYI